MTQALAPYEGKQPVAMKGGLVHWVTTDTAERIQQQLQTQTAHTFMRIRELNITINTAEVEGVYTMDQYEDLCKVKQGMWQCEYRNWHNKGKRECECKKDFFSQQVADRKKQQQADEDRPLTKAEQEINRERFTIMNERAALSGKAGSIFRNMYKFGGARKIRRSTIDAWEEKNGPARLDDLAIEEDVQNAIRSEAADILD